MENSINAIENYIIALKSTVEYQKFMNALHAVKEVPGLKEQVDSYRRQNFLLQNSESTSFEAVESFDKEYEGFRENPLVEEFLDAELAFCRMMQYNNSLILEALHFE